MVDKLLRDLKIAEAKAWKKTAQAKAKKEAAKAKAEKKAAQAKAKQEAAEAKEEKKDLDPDPVATPTRVGETPDSPKAQSMPSNGTQHAAPQKAEVSPKEAEAEAALEEVAPEEAPATQQRSVQEANPSAQEQQAFPEEAGVAAEDVGKDTAGAMPQADSAVAQVKKTKAETRPQPLVEDCISVETLSARATKVTITLVARARLEGHKGIAIAAGLSTLRHAPADTHVFTAIAV